MIIPQPESDLSLNIMVVGADIIKILRKGEDTLIVDDLLKKFLNRDKRRTPTLFFDVLTFLFAIGAIKEDTYRVRLKYGYTQATLFGNRTI